MTSDNTALRRETGRAKAIGVSNCSQLKLEEILDAATVVPAVDQVRYPRPVPDGSKGPSIICALALPRADLDPVQLEITLYCPSRNLIEYLRSKGIVPQAYSPFGSTNAPILKDELVQALASKYKADPAQILISWLGKSFLQMGIALNLSARGRASTLTHPVG